MVKTKQKENEEKETKDVKQMSLEEAVKAVETAGVHVRKPQPGSVAERQLFHYAQQPKVRYRYPRATGEKVGAFETVITNDLMITVKKGVTVDLPEDIAKDFDDSLQITDAALRKGSLQDLPSDSPLSR